MNDPLQSSPLDLACGLQGAIEDFGDRDAQKRKGQFFTPARVAVFMASLPTELPPRLRVLDPGAGVGILTAAFCVRLAESLLVHEVEFDLYENDESILPSLGEVARACEAYLAERGHRVEIRIHSGDFITANAHRLSGPTLFDPEAGHDPFDFVFMNPPYFKLRKNSPHATMLRGIVHGQPNIYALFMAVGCALLGTNGQMISITPRSFCNGLYFREFRKWMFERAALVRIHLFHSRKELFARTKVLQENIVTVFTRVSVHPATVCVSSSDGNAHPAPRLKVDRALIIDSGDPEKIIHIPESPSDVEILENIRNWPSRFADTGLRISTGPIVPFRCREHLLTTPGAAACVPLLTSANVRRTGVRWPSKTTRKPVAFADSDSSKKHLILNRNYVFLKRFTAKEESRRLVAAAYCRDEIGGERIGVENHLNYIYHRDRELSRDEVSGIAALFNSPVMDRYFRLMSGNTQVNATEIRQIPFPRLHTVAALGARIRGTGDDEMDRVVADFIRHSIERPEVHA